MVDGFNDALWLSESVLLAAWLQGEEYADTIEANVKHANECEE